MDVVEVLRGTAASGLLIAASAAGTVAAVATVLAVISRWAAASGLTGAAASAPTGTAAPGPTRAAASRWLLVVALTTSALELTLLLLDGASLTGRWTAVALVRLLLLAGLALLPAPSAAADAGGLASPAGRLGAVLGAALLATSVLGAPTATGALPAGWGGIVIAAGLAVVLAAATLLVLRLSTQRGRTTTLVGLAVLLLVVAVPAALATAPDRIPPHQQTQLTVAGLTLDVTVAPVGPGPNEFHLYAFGPDGRPAPLREATVEVVGEPDTRHRLFPVSPDHHLSYALELPAGGAWELQIGLIDGDDRPLEVVWPITAPE